MRIDYLQISNILSFPFFENIENAQKICFTDGLNIIIGENGSGKSTALEAINFIFKRVFFRQFSFNRDMFDRRDNLNTSDLSSVIQLFDHREISSFRLGPNWNNEDSEQRIRIAVKLDDIDRSNIDNIKRHFDSLSRIIDPYQSHRTSQVKDCEDDVVVDIFLDRQRNNFSCHIAGGKDHFGFHYLHDYNFFKESINLYNRLNPDAQVPPILESFSLISSYRNYSSLQTSVTLRDAGAEHQIQQLSAQEFSRSLNSIEQQEPSIFALVRLKVAERHFELMPQAKTRYQCDAEANDLAFIRAINERLKAINLRCEIRLTDQRTWQQSFQFHDLRRDKPLGDINSLSAGQKAIIHLILEAYGRGDSLGGVVIIDEPEIHLHYQYQYEYFQIVRDLNKLQNCQYILVTHSEALIDSSTIESVRRFSLGADGSTYVYSPSLTSPQKHLIKILDNTRSTYAFFAKKVILVEGDSDRYFFRVLIQNYFRHMAQEIAILDVRGKYEFEKWKTLFSSFGLEVYIITDFDYLASKQYAKTKRQKLNTIKAVIDFKSKHTDWADKITQERGDNVFVLQEGDLEIYLGINKDLNNVITFCENSIEQFFSSEHDHKSLELLSIIHDIVK